MLEAVLSADTAAPVETAAPGARSVAAKPAAPRLSAVGLTCVRDDRVLFRDLGLAVQPGEVLQVDGRNGSGKTSLLRILCGLSLPAEGTVLWNGQPIARVRSEFLLDLSYLGHAPGVKLELTPVENLRIARALKRPRIDLGIEEALERVGLLGFEDVPARSLSAGQCRRVALARLLVTRSRLWVLDEPFTAIDRRGVADVEALIAEHTCAGGMVVLTSHHPVRLPDCQVRSLHLTA
ncbi:MAG: cytochrome c biogenesis heme-transporting ATPase CcmA [Gammaproteobacteria bacterium]|jgi:heme exporter protein A|nr:cytochrome c biogenesis heme-transporting ATPase CcmA [Gammaproteobacteria bacterium]